MEINLHNIKCPICKDNSFLKLVYNESDKAYHFKCNKCKMESVNRFTDSINLFKNFDNLKWNRFIK